jgi:hypothetical protein
MKFNYDCLRSLEATRIQPREDRESGPSLGRMPRKRNAPRESGGSEDRLKSPASIRVRTRIFKQGARPAFSFAAMGVQTVRVALTGASNTSIHNTNLLKSLHL